MALNWNWKDKMGKMTIEQNGKEHVINIYAGNCLAIFLNEFKDKETGEDMYNLYDFFADKQHVKNIKKDKGKVFFADIKSVELDMRFKSAKDLLNIFLEEGYRVTCYKSTEQK